MYEEENALSEALIFIHREGRRERGVADELMEQEKTREHFKKGREKKE